MGAAATQRFGEASHPGPSCTTSFSLGTINVAGAANKIPALAELPAGYWGVTESHLTHFGMRSFSKALKHECALRHQPCHLAFGAPVPPRSPASSAGTWAGVFSYSSFPLRGLRAASDDVPHLAGRLQFVSLMVNNMQITGACLYGASKGPSYKDPVGITTEMELITSTIVRGHQGPRFILGDFNTDLLETLPTQQWQEAGWQEVQAYLLDAFQVPIKPTCKSKTVRDFVWLSPEMMPFVRGGGVLPGRFPDHDAVYAQLEFSGDAVRMRQWPMPRTIDWKQVQLQQWHQACEQHVPHTWSSPMAASFASWSAAIEDSVAPFYGAEDGRLPAACRGRGATLAPKIGALQQPHVKPARPGEEPLKSSFVSRMIHQRYRQLRRLQSLLHCLRNGVRTSNAQLYVTQLWRSIRLAKSFDPDFVTWWCSRPMKLEGSPQFLGVNCPTLAALEIIFDDYKFNFRDLESWHIKKRGAVVKARQESSMKQLFRALRPDATHGLSFLQRTKKCMVLDLDPVQAEVLLQSPPELSAGQCTLHNKPIVLTDSASISVDDDAAWFQYACDIAPCIGDEIVHQIPCTSMHDIQQELLSLWLPRWQPDTPITEERWQRISGLVQAYLPSGVLPAPQPCASSLRSTLTGGNGLRTRGPDAWSKADLLSLPAPHLDDLAAMYSGIENGLEWPSQVIRGHVHCLEKTTDAVQASHYRPVVLFGLPYRLWSSFRSRMLIPALSQRVHFHAFGYLSGRSSSQLAYQVQAQIEAAIVTAEHIGGFTTDIEKCFNFLERPWVSLIAEHLGVSTSIMRAWNSFLDAMTRSFIINDWIGQDNHSTSGYSEGDSLSCVALLTMTFALHNYMLHYMPTISTWSYVDNLQAIGHHAGEVQQAFLVMSTWADLFGLRLDTAKTLYWASDRDLRAQLAALQLPVVESAKDLGVHMVYGSRLRNHSLQDRLRAVEPYWSRLRRMSVSLWHKGLAIRMALLPRALYGAAHVLLGRTWIRKLRTGAMRALRADRPGANPALRLACLMPIQTDPGYFEAWLVFREFQRNLQQCASLRAQWAYFTLRGSSKTTCGPFMKVETFCHALHWYIDEDVTLHLADDLAISLLAEESETLELLLQYAWRQHVAGDLAMRKDFEGLEGMNVEASFPSNNLSPQDSELLNCIRDGTFHLRTFKAKFDASISSDCPHCAQPDTLEHRALLCPFFADIRAQFADCTALWRSSTQAFTQHGIVSANPWQWPFWRHLSSLQYETPVWTVTPMASETQHLFLDGSCRSPTSPCTSLASWAVILANRTCPLAAGILPGIRQTINRAELWAAVVAVSWAAHFQVVAELWSDSQYVVDGFCFLLHLLLVPEEWQNRDLWLLLLEALRRCSSLPSIHKVAAHRKVDEVESSFLKWCAYYNGMADSNAKAAVLLPFDPLLPDLYSNLCREQQRACHAAVRQQEFLLALAKRGLDGSASSSSGPDYDDALDGLFQLQHGALNEGDFIEQFPIAIDSAILTSTILVQMGQGVSRSLSAWFCRLSDEADYVLDVTVLEMCVGFLSDGHELPFLVSVRDHPEWVLPSQFIAGELLGQTLSAKLNSFTRLLRAFVQVACPDAQWGHASRPTCGIMKIFPTLRIPWSDRIATKVHCILSDFAYLRPVRSAADLARPFR